MSLPPDWASVILRLEVGWYKNLHLLLYQNSVKLASECLVLALYSRKPFAKGIYTTCTDRARSALVKGRVHHKLSHAIAMSMSSAECVVAHCWPLICLSRPGCLILGSYQDHVLWPSLFPISESSFPSPVSLLARCLITVL